MEERKKKECQFLYTIFFVCVVVIFQYRLNVKNTSASSFYRYFPNLRSHRYAIIPTRLQTLYVQIKVELYIDAFIHLSGGGKQVC